MRKYKAITGDYIMAALFVLYLLLSACSVQRSMPAQHQYWGHSKKVKKHPPYQP